MDAPASTLEGTPGLAPALAEGFGWAVTSVRPAGRVLRVETTTGAKCAKPSRLAPEEIAFCARAIGYLRSRGLAQIPALALTATGQPWLEYEGVPYVGMDWVSGRELDFRSAADLAAAARVLARLHRASAGFTPAQVPAGRFVYGTWPERFRTRLGELAALADSVGRQPALDPFDRLFLRLAPERIRAGEEALSLLARSAYPQASSAARESGCLCHHDPAHHNFLAADNETWLLDFDYLLCDLPLHDTGSLVRRGVKAWGWDCRAAGVVLRSYAGERRLTPGWAAVLWAFLLWPQEFWRVARQRYVESLPWPPEKYLSRLEGYADTLEARTRCLGRLRDELHLLEAEQGLDCGPIPGEGGGPESSAFPQSPGEVRVFQHI